LFAKSNEASGNDYGELPSVLTGNSAIYFRSCKWTEGNNKDFRKKSANRFERCLSMLKFILR
jgi:large subunit ribosomal protein L10